MQEKTISVESTFARDVRTGLTSFPKFLSSRYFYDEKGDKLFQDIMNMPEYYLTRKEYEILNSSREEITRLFFEETSGIDLIELGAGDGKKTKILLRHMSEKGLDFTYIPIDISQNALDLLENSICEELPGVQVQSMQGTYFEVLEQLGQYNDRRKVLLFLGSNIGNLLHENAVDFLSQIRELMNENDLLFIGFDQKKNPQTILNAYNDAQGITAEFNKNLLRRINQELDGDFNTDTFLHWEVYDPESGTAKSYLVSKLEQTVNLNTLDLKVHFKAWETIHTEISQKYDDEVVTWLAGKAGLQIEHVFSDSEKYFKDYLFRTRR